MKATTTELLTQFVNQRPSLNFADYGDRTLYRRELREITADRTDFYELLALANDRIGEWVNGQWVSNLDAVLTDYLKKSSGRLTLNDKGQLEYCTGQYFPTEYRPAACRVLANIIWASYRDEIEHNSPNPVYKDGHEIRKAIRRRVSRRVALNYFN
jgi:hypothetical protein